MCHFSEGGNRCLLCAAIISFYLIATKSSNYVCYLIVVDIYLLYNKRVWVAQSYLHFLAIPGRCSRGLRHLILQGHRNSQEGLGPSSPGNTCQAFPTYQDASSRTPERALVSEESQAGSPRVWGACSCPWIPGVHRTKSLKPQKNTSPVVPHGGQWVSDMCFAQ